MFVRQFGKDFYVCKRSRSKTGRASEKYHYSSTFMIKWNKLSGVLNNKQPICFPQELIGKKIRLKVEII